VIDMAEIKDKVITVESLSALHEHNKETYTPKVDPSVSGNLVVEGSLSMNRQAPKDIGTYSTTLGFSGVASGSSSLAEGFCTIAKGNYQHVQGKNNIEDGLNRYAHIVGNGDLETRSNAHTVDWDGNAWFAGDIYVGGTSQDDGTKLVKSTNVVSIEYGDELPAAGNAGRIFFKKLNG
jgi:hypothetical protein